MAINAFIIEWTETEADWGMRPDGYSIHKSPEAAAAYLKGIYDKLPPGVPDEYSYPSSGWHEPASASPVEIPDDSLIAKELEQSDSTRVYRVFSDGDLGKLYVEARALRPTGEPVRINYATFSEEHIAHVASARATFDEAAKRMEGMPPDQAREFVGRITTLATMRRLTPQ